MKSCHLGRSVSIIGVDYTPMGTIGVSPEFEGITEYELFANACIGAMEDGGIKAKDIDAYYVGMCSPNYFNRVDTHAPHFAEWIGMRNKPTIFHDEGCGTIAFGVHQAVLAVASGAYDCVMSAAVNCQSTLTMAGKPPFVREPLDMETMNNALFTAVDPAYENLGMGGLKCMEGWIMCYLKENGYSPENYEEAMVNYVTIMRNNALNNPKALNVKMSFEEEAAMFGFSDVKSYLTNDMFNPRIGSLVRARYSGAPADGAAAVIVCATEEAYKYTKKPIEVAGIGTSSSLIKDIHCTNHFPTQECIREAYTMAGITDPYNEIEYMGEHDCTGANTIIDPENYGYMKKGECLRAMIEGRITKDDAKPINTGGGRTQLGHPLAPAFGIEIDEAVRQIRGENGARQMPRVPRTAAISGGGAGFCWIGMVLRAGF